MISIALSSTPFTPIHFIFAVAKYTNEKIEVIPNDVIHITDWGKSYGAKKSLYLHDCNSVIHILWHSIIENQYYEFMQPLEEFSINEQSQLIIGCSSDAKVCIWNYDEKKSKIITYTKGTCVDDNLSQLIRNEKNIFLSDREKYSPNELKDFLIEELSPNFFPIESASIILDHYMKQFEYCYLTLFGYWNHVDNKWVKSRIKNQIEFDYIEEALYDGTHDKLHDGGLMKYHQAGKPKKLRVQWHIGKSEYSAYFWFEDERIRDVFDKFYGAHPDTKTDFIIRIDAENRKYELALYRYGLKEPQIIPEDAYQLLVFKNKFEDYRSENYNQERGAWIW